MSTSTAFTRTPSNPIRWLGLTGWLTATVLTVRFVVDGGITPGSAPSAALLAVAVTSFIAPDLTFLAGLGQPVRPGFLPARAVVPYNAMHVIWGPLALAAVAVLMASRPALASVLLVAALSWGAHVLLDRAAGYGLRRPDGGR